MNEERIIECKFCDETFSSRKLGTVGYWHYYKVHLSEHIIEELRGIREALKKPPSEGGV